MPNRKLEELQPQVWERVIQVVGAGLSKSDAARLADMGLSTLTKRIKDDEGFRRRVERAQAEPKQKALSIVWEIAQGEGQPAERLRAAIWILERLFPNEFGQKSTLRLEREPDQMTKAEIVAELKGHLAALEDGGAEGDGDAGEG